MNERAAAAVNGVRQALLRGDVPAASAALAMARALSRMASPRTISEEQLQGLQTMIDTMPAAALQVLQHGLRSPFSALGVERRAEARSLSAVNRRSLLKRYRQLALQLHPDRCEHVMAVDAMQVLNAIYDSLTDGPQPRAVGLRPGSTPPPQQQRRRAQTAG